MKYLICYDICEQKRLHKVARILEENAIRTQKSFFCLDASETRCNQILTQLALVIKQEEDRLSCYPICDKCFGKIRAEGQSQSFLFPEYVVL
ncbi:MAG: CRISPR-associated endonuclease Cas2 [Sphaerochaetaceae bacterium]|nr:CRISPR-associated endonuclease Cas2 [Spirochaetales bacterium]MDY5500216.1 CRISPR-associated endonuclease Cas2 [Sphaerochaetaceae bacterium]